MPGPCKVPKWRSDAKNCSSQSSTSARCALGRFTRASNALAPRVLYGA